MAAAAADEMVAATDVADLLVRKGLPFREAHGVVGGLVRAAVESGRALSDLERSRSSPSTPSCSTTSTTTSWREGAWLDSKLSAGGTAAPRLAEQLDAARRVLAELRPASERTPSEPEFFARSVHEVARELVGCELLVDGVGGAIVETESYERDDPACHAYVGLTARTATLFGPPGRAYVYLSYGIHSSAERRLSSPRAPPPRC